MQKCMPKWCYQKGERMNLRKFLKPTIGKILIFIIIFLLSFSFGIKEKYWHPEWGSEDPESDFPPCIETTLNPFLWWPYYSTYGKYLTICVYEKKGLTLIDRLLNKKPIQFMATLIYWYVFSCLIVKIYENIDINVKIKRKKK